MLNFLLSNKNEAIISTSQNKEAFVDEFFEQLKQEMPAAYIHHGGILQSKNKLTLKATPFRYIWNGWNIFNPITKAEFEFSQVAEFLKLETKTSFNEFFITSFLLSFASLPGFWLGKENYSIMWIVGVWLIFYVGSRMLNHLRMSNFITKLILKTEKVKTPHRDIEDVWNEDKKFVADILMPMFMKNKPKKF